MTTITKKKINGVADSIFPVVFSLMFMLLSFTITISITGCKMFEAKANTNIEGKGLDTSQKNTQSAAGDVKNQAGNNNNIAEKAKNQTTNNGVFSGGAPYLLTAIIVIITGGFGYLKYKDKLERQEEKEQYENIIEVLKTLLRYEGKAEAEILSHIQKAKLKGVYKVGRKI